MLNFTEAQKEAFLSAAHKRITITFPNSDIKPIENDRIYSESMTIIEALCENSTLTFGECVPSQFEIQVADVEEDIKGKEINVTLEFDCLIPLYPSDYIFPSNSLFPEYGEFSDLRPSDNLYPGDDLYPGRVKTMTVNLFHGIIDIVERQKDRRLKKITAFDLLYSIGEKNIADFYNNLHFPMTVKELRLLLFKYLGITQKAVTLPNDGIRLNSSINPEEIKAAEVIRSICQINSCFGRMSKDNVFEYVFLHETDTEEYDSYQDLEYKDFVVKPITKLQIRQEEGDIGAIAGTGDNTYVIQGNFLVYGLNADQLKQVANNILPFMQKISYRPFTAKVDSRIWVETGDRVYIKNSTQDIDSIVLKRTITGIQALKDIYEASGEEKQAEIVIDANVQIKQLQGRTNKLIRTVDETQTTIENTRENLQTQITQNDTAIKTKVTKGAVSSEISQEAGKIDISANRLSVDSDNFKLDYNGNVKANGVFKTVEIEEGETEAYRSAELSAGGLLISWLGDGVAEFKGEAFSSGTGVYGMSMNVLKEFFAFVVNGERKYMIDNRGGQPRHQFRDDMQVFGKLTANGVRPSRIDWNNGTSVYQGSLDEEAGTYVDGSLYIEGGFACGGSKNRVVKTSAGTVAMNAVESTEAMFSDYGTGEISGAGSVKIEIDPLFAETITEKYFIFITNTNELKTHYVKKHSGFFIVYGEPGAIFDYCITAHQKGYENERMKKINTRGGQENGL